MVKLLNWIDERFPLTALWESQWGKYVAPKNFNFWYYFGSLAAFVLVLQIVTGIFLTMNYKPDAAKAFESVEYIMRDVEWRGKVVWLLNRTQPMLDSLPKLDSRVADPQSKVQQQPPYCQNEHRSIKPMLFVAVGICTHLGCSPTYRKEIAPADLGPDWLGGFFCPCHQSKFDLAGRVYKGVPAPLNLVVPPHKYASDTQVVIGEDTKKA